MIWPHQVLDDLGEVDQVKAAVVERQGFDINVDLVRVKAPLSSRLHRDLGDVHAAHICVGQFVDFNRRFSVA